MQDGTFNGGKRMQRTGYISQANTFIIYTQHKQGSNDAITQEKQGKSNTTEYSYYLQHLISSTYGHGTTTSTQKQKERPPHSQGSRT